MRRLPLDSAVLEIDDVSIDFPTTGTDIVRNASLSIARGQISGLVGESGSGKTMLARAVLGLLPPGARTKSGSIHFQGRDLLELDTEELRRLRGASIGMVFQEPMMSLNPSMRIGEQMAEAVMLHTGASKTAV